MERSKTTQRIIELAKTVKFTDNIASTNIDAEHDLQLMKIKAVLNMYDFKRNSSQLSFMERAKAILEAEDTSDMVVSLSQFGYDPISIIQLIECIYETSYCIEDTDRNLQLASALAYANWVGDITIEQIKQLQLD